MRRAAIIFAVCALLLSCRQAPHTVTISDGPVSLTYDCSHITPQAKTTDEILTLRQKAVDVITEAGGKEDFSLSRSLKTARDIKDWRRMEELIVEYECSKAQRRK